MTHGKSQGPGDGNQHDNKTLGTAPTPQPPRSCVKTDLSADVLVSGGWAGRDGHCGPRTSEVLRLQNRFNARMSVRSPAAASTALGVQRPPDGRHGPPLFASQPQRARPRPSFCRLHDSPEKRGARPRGPRGGNTAQTGVSRVCVTPV